MSIVNGTLLVIVILLIADTVRAQRKKVDCNAAVIRADRCFQSMIYMNATRLPRSEEEIRNGFCEDLKTNINCMNSRARRNCYTSFARTLYDSGARTTGNYFRGYCKSDESRTKLANELMCFMDNQMMAREIKRFSDEITLGFEHATKQPSDQVIPHVCCSYHYIGQRFKNKTDEFCQQRGKPKPSSYFFAEMLEGILSESIDLICGKYASEQACEKELAEGMKNIIALIDVPTLPTIQYSMIVAMDKFVKLMQNEFN